ncbi:MAG TPA: hypothetical protein VGX25_05385 [Actinophytocola sp.]|uniref:hypothetical protein n=1 Tax=Actinophytocola sp. TaxID=1872138 RepID=UPI002DDD1950|nr:hypothetical protein [Actinophytocola sp.]HEV2778815.1 hypothetical protein [Actinophytocola sp.]
MAKENGLGWTTCAVDDAGGTARNIRNDATNLQFATPRAVQDVTGLDKSAIERILNLTDFTGTLNGVFNDASNQSHDVFKTVPSTSVVRTFTNTVSGQTLACECVVTDYPLTRSPTGEFLWAVPFALADGAVPTWA